MIELMAALLWWIGLLVSAGISVLVIVCLGAWVIEALSERDHFDRDHAGRVRLGLNEAPAPLQRPGARDKERSLA